MTSAHLLDENSEFIKISGPEEIEPGDIVYEVVRYGTGPKDVRYNEHKVLGVERGALRAARLDAKGRVQHPIKLSFHALVRKRPVVEESPSPRTQVITPGVVRRIGQRQSGVTKKSAIVTPPPKASEQTAQPSADFAAYLEMSREILSSARRELHALAEKRAIVAAEIEAIDARHKRQIEALETQIAALRQDHQRDRGCGVAALEAMVLQREALEARIGSLESMLQAVTR